MLTIHNNLTRKKEIFTPIDAHNVRMYVCGMTVYDYCHIGHARVLVVFDVVYRYLCAIYGEQHVTYIRNVTDIDDKIIARANENGEDINALTGRFIEAMHQDADALGVIRPNQEPRATLYMPQIIDMISTLVEKGYAYAAANGDVYYDVSRFEKYGQLSGKKPDDLRAGARVEVDEAKDDPLDFVLWKSVKPDEPFWDSPWGKGRPGWHIECSAMSVDCLGSHFDIHGGGLDLQFPHHENEIAQTCAATDDDFANTWMHNGFVRVDDEKMSKSLGNFFTIREVLERYHPEVIRFFILSSHYRSPLNYSDQHLDNAKASLTTLYTALRDIEPVYPETESETRQRFIAAMDDDFSTPEAISILFELAREINRHKQSEPKVAQHLAGELHISAKILGLLQNDAEGFLKSGTGLHTMSGLTDEQIENMIEERLSARKNKDWAEADRLRDELKKAGILIEDGSGGTSWRRE